MTPTNEEIYAMAWHLGNRLNEVHEQLLCLDQSHHTVLKLLANSVLEMPDEVRADLLSSVSRYESVLDQHAAFLNDAKAFFQTLPKP
jgi:hypothetical protein